jgi:NADPH:quinone reductase-like Zn-dependent oxidoreductase/acyl carrier protein
MAACLIRCCCLKKERDYRLSTATASLYREAWAESATAEPATELAGLSLVLWDWSNHAKAMSAELARAGAQVRYYRHDEHPGTSEDCFLVWAAPESDGTESEEPSSAAVFNAVWPLVRLAQALAGESRPLRLLLVTAGATWGQPADGAPPPNLVQASVAGLLRAVATELTHIDCRLIDLDPSEPREHIAQVLGELQAGSPESEVAYRAGRRFTQRLQHWPLKELAPRALSEPCLRSAAYHLASLSPGGLEYLRWLERNAPPPAEGEVEIAVRAAGLNFRDVLKALDLYPLEPSEPRMFGDECAGVIHRVGSGVSRFKPGDEVVAITPGCFGNIVRVHSCLVASKPPNLSFADAATIPIAFLTAGYALLDLANLQPGETVLIHAAAGGVGLAAVQFALRRGATVFGTASPEKHDFLLAQGVSRVFHSRNLSFTGDVWAATGGEGVDVVLNSLSGEFMVKSLELVKPLGRFIEIGKKDIFQNEPLDLDPFRKAVSFHALDLVRVITARPQWIGERLSELLERFAGEEFRPLPLVTYGCRHIDEAFRLMAQGKHRGKIVITFDEQPETVLAAGNPPIRSGATYLVTGGLSGFGWATAEWLVEQGATSLVLVSRTGAAGDEIRQTLAAWRARSITVKVDRCDVTDAAAIDALIHDITAGLPPLAGVFHSAMVLQDELLPRLTAEVFECVLAPKVQGAWNLHRATEQLPLDHFVMYSSCAALLGSAGQGNYIVANRFLDALAAYRRAQALPALAVNWGPLAEVGVVAGRPGLARYLESVGLSPLPQAEVFDWLRFLLRRDVTSAGVMRIDWEKFGDANLNGRATDRSSGRFAAVMAARTAAGTGEMLQLLAAAEPAERRPLVLNHLRSTAAAVLRADATTIEEDVSLAALGLDSLMAFELKMKIERELGLVVPAGSLSSGTRLGQLADLLVAQFGFEHQQPISAEPQMAARPAAPASGDEFYRIVPKTKAGPLSSLRLDAAALAYLPDKLETVGGLNNSQIRDLFGREPFVSNYFDTPLGRIGIITLPVRSPALFQDPAIPDVISSAIDLAAQRGATCVSLTGLIPSATNYGWAVMDRRQGREPVLTTGHATTTAAVVTNLEHMLRLAGRALNDERFAILGLGSIGQSCARLMLEVLPHPNELVLCDLFANEEILGEFARVVQDEHGYRGTVRVVQSTGGVPDEVYAASTILAAVSVSEIIDPERLQPGTIVVDDSYPPAFHLDRMVRRATKSADVLFSNAGMLRLPRPVYETFVLPAGGETVLERFGVAAFRDEMARDPNELTACVLSSVLTNRYAGFDPTLGMARTEDLVRHYLGLESLGLRAARLQCENYFVPDSIVCRFAGRYRRLPAPLAAEHGRQLADSATILGD